MNQYFLTFQPQSLRFNGELTYIFSLLENIYSGKEGVKSDCTANTKITAYLSCLHDSKPEKHTEKTHSKNNFICDKRLVFFRKMV